MNSNPSKRADENEWDAADYDSSHSFVYEYGEDVLELLDPQPDERILDLGCGTGHLTNRIAESGADVVGLDSSERMITQARLRFPDRTFVHADAREFVFDAPFDAVFSNAALHWIDSDDHTSVLENVGAHLRPAGRFVAECGGAGNVQAITDAVRAELTAHGYEVEQPWYFPSVGEYAPRLESHGFEVRFGRLFDRPTELEGGENGLATWLEMFGDPFFAPLSDTEARDVISAVEDRLMPTLFQDGTWVADYRRLRFIAVKTDAG